METGCHSLHRLKHRAVIALIIVCSLLFYITCMHIYFYQKTLELIGILKYADQDIQQELLYNLFTGSVSIKDGKYVLMKNGYQFSGQYFLFFDLTEVGISIGFLIVLILLLFIYGNYMKKKNDKIDKELDYLKTEIEHYLFGTEIVRNDTYKECNYLLDRLEQRLQDMSLLNTKEWERMMDFHQNIIHQINTPLNTIKILTEYLAIQGKVDDNYLDNMNYAIEKAAYLARIYLKSSKLGTGKVIYHFEEIDLYDLIEESILNLKIYANYHHSVLVNKCDNSKIYADFLWIKEAVENIIKNFIENSVDRSKILISSFSVDNTVIIRIDNESSICGKVDEISFERFESSKSGIGIGLHLCKQIVEAHLGEISVENNRFGGLGFIIKLPRQSHKNKVNWRIRDEDNS